MLRKKEVLKDIMPTIKTRNHEVSLTGLPDNFTATLTTSHAEDGIDTVHLRLEAAIETLILAVKLSWSQPMVDAHAFWHPGSDVHKQVRPDWAGPYISKATSLAPVGCLYNFRGHNRLTFAFSDALNPLSIEAGVHEETATLACVITLFAEPMPPLSVYEATLRLDTRPVPYYTALADVGAWWASQPGYTPAFVPEIARLPMYSTWYSFHQELTPGEVEEQCRLARLLGCEAIIVDDGWQTRDTGRGFAYCGDWQVSPEKIPDMRAHVERVHELGLKYLLWYSVPFVGKHSQAWTRFDNKLLQYIDKFDAGVLDPRFPDVREYIINTYEQALYTWDLDGFKLDFVDDFNFAGRLQDTATSERDYVSVPAAVDRLLTDVVERLRRIKPDIMIEFRQGYIGPLMRKYGTMFRAADCPNDAISNRIRTIDIRLLSGTTPAHSDMLMWHPDEPVESAALQLLNVLFAVPQISVRLDRLPPRYVEMLRFWLQFWREHRDVLLDGTLQPLHPEALYPIVIATTDVTRIVGVYADTIVQPGPAIPSRFMIVNGTQEQRVVLELEADLDLRMLEIRDCCGQLVRKEQVRLCAGLHRIDMPAAGLAILSQRTQAL